ncbi:MAG: TerB family tellurite resistance protein [Desulfomonilia bacterium]|jgi:uncharacterized tellurite resistance protein B-like protein
MIDLVKRILGVGRSPGAAETKDQGGHHIVVAACALLLEMANIDGEFTEEEGRIILSYLERLGLEKDKAESVIQSARRELEQSIDLWRFARVINRHYSEEEKLKVIETVWKVVFADGRLEKHEDHLAHSLGRLLRLDHSQLIEAKLRVKGSTA